MINLVRHRAAPLALGLTLAAATVLASGSAQAGFLDDLFGGGTTQPTQPTYNYSAPQQMSPDMQVAPKTHRAPKKIAAREVPQNKQRTTDLWHDKSLRVGDAVMMKDGVHIYLGSDGARHSAKDFVAIDNVDNVPKKEYAALTAMDTTRNDPLKTGAAPDTLASGRSAAVGVPVTKGYKITDARGNSVRYVGP